MTEGELRALIEENRALNASLTKRRRTVGQMVLNVRTQQEQLQELISNAAEYFETTRKDIESRAIPEANKRECLRLIDQHERRFFEVVEAEAI